MNKITRIAVLVAFAASASLHGMAMAHPEHDAPVPKVQPAEVKADLMQNASGAKVVFTKGAETVSTVGATGTLMLLDAKDKTSYTLKPAPGNTMTSEGLKKLSKGARAQVNITFADKTMLATELVAK